MDLPEADKKLMQKNSGEIYQCIWNWFENWERERERERESDEICESFLPNL